MKENESMWSKKADDLTVSESIQATAVATVVLTAASVGIWVAIGGAVSLVEKIRARKARKDQTDQ